MNGAAVVVVVADAGGCGGRVDSKLAQTNDPLPSLLHRYSVVAWSGFLFALFARRRRRRLKCSVKCVCARADEIVCASSAKKSRLTSNVVVALGGGGGADGHIAQTSHAAHVFDAVATQVELNAASEQTGA